LDIDELLVHFLSEGGSESFFWNKKPKLIFAFLHYRTRKEAMQDYRFAVLAHLMRSIVGDKKSKLTDFFSGVDFLFGEEDEDTQHRYERAKKELIAKKRLSQ